MTSPATFEHMSCSWSGEPAFGSTVRAYRWVMSSGERTLQAAATAAVDDRGTYRLPLPPPGDYIVGIASRTGIDLGMIAASTRYERVMVTVNDLRMLEVTSP